MHLTRLLIQDVGSIALNTRRVTGHDDAHVVLRDNLHGIMVGIYLNIRMRMYGTDQAGLDLCACIIGMVQDAELRVATLLVEVELAIGLLIELHTPVDQSLDLRRSFPHYFFHSRTIADPVASYHGVFDVFLEVIHLQISH